jgi:DisA checkpoint controller-like protein
LITSKPTAASETQSIAGAVIVISRLQTIPETERAIEQTENLISLFLGDNPATISRGRSLTQQEGLPSVPAGLPASLLERRPDIRAAATNLEAQGAPLGPVNRVDSCFLPPTPLRDTVKELAQLDGAFVVSDQGIVVSACRYLDAMASDVALPDGLASRHLAGDSISQATDAVSIVVSESSMVRVFDDGTLVAEIIPELWLMDHYNVQLSGPDDEYIARREFLYR